MTYSNDLRLRVIWAHKSKMGAYNKIAKRLFVSEAFVKNVIRHYYKTGQIDTPSKMDISPKKVISKT